MIKDIVNRDIINLINCESEPIHIPGSIQPHGFVLVLSRPDFKIIFCSANTENFIGIQPEALLNQYLAAVFPQAIEAFEVYIKDFVPGTTYPHVFSLEAVSYNTTISESGDYYLLELEPFPDGSLHLPNLYSQTKKFISLIERSSYLQDLCQSVANETRVITGYDRVMIYRFDEEYNGEVLAESKREDLDSFLDHRYPHTDIPPQARALYLRNLLRIIVDVSYTPVPLLTMEATAGHESLDLSNAILRSVSPIHIEYLKNMGVGATLTISLLHEGRLWGLIACHHYEPKNLPHYTRLAAQLQGHFLTSQISVREVKEVYEIAQQCEQYLQELQGLLQRAHRFVAEHYAHPALLHLTGAGGVAILQEGKIYRQGNTPEDAQLKRLVQWLIANAINGSFSTSSLWKLYPDAGEFATVASGVIFHSLGMGDDCIIWFKPEVVQTLHWAGDPNKAVLKGEDGMRLTPRKSFELWREFVKCQSTAWSQPQLNAGASFAYALQRHLLFQYLSREEERYRRLSEQLQEANEELANINWISTHDLKEPLRKIQVFGSRIIEEADQGLSAGVVDGIMRMRKAANRMQVLLDDIHAYARLSDKDLAYTEVDLNVVVSNVISAMSEELNAMGATLMVKDLPVVYGIPFQLQQLVQNLLGNSMKFADPARQPTIHMSSQVVQDARLGEGSFYKIAFRDNGIGFENSYASRIFEVFQRLHTASYSGTGIGLSICRKIMTNHGGAIAAEGEVGAGAIFLLYFPVVS